MVINDGYRAKNLELGNTGLPFARAGNINNGFQFEDADKFPETNRAKLGEKTSKPGDVVFTSKGTVGRFAFVGNDTPEFVYSPQLCFWRSLDHSKLNPRWLYYWMNGREFFGQFKGVSNQSDMAEYVSLRDQRSMEITLVDPQDQSTISNILGAFDDKIALNRKINETLEGMARALFQSWFVDFDPVKAKLAAKRHERDPERACMAALSGKLRIAPGKPRAERLDAQLPTADELDAAMAALVTLTEAQRQQLRQTASAFPDDFEDSELGLIPLRWEVCKLSDIIQLIGGGTPQKSKAEYWNGTIPWFSVKDAPYESEVFVLETEEKITDQGLKESSTRLLAEGTTIISARGTVGRIALVGIPMAMNQSCYGVVGVDGIPPFFNYYNLYFAVNVLKQRTHGAVFDTITRNTFETVDQILGPKKCRMLFEKTITPIMKQIKAHVHQSRTLAELRDALLPRLLSGELSISATEDSIEEAGVS